VGIPERQQPVGVEQLNAQYVVSIGCRVVPDQHPMTGDGTDVAMKVRNRDGHAAGRCEKRFAGKS